MDHEAIADELDDGADLIESQGWFNDRLGMNREEGVCAYLALNRSEAFEALRAYIGSEGIIEWNDSFDEPQPVLDGLRGCAKSLRQIADANG